MYPLILTGLVVILINSCKKDDHNSQAPELTTNIVSNITSISAICGGVISDDEGATVTVRGVCWSTGITPTIADSKTTDGTGAGSFTSNITGLSGNTTYYVRAYATSSDGTGYGSAMAFTTNPVVTDVDGNVYNTVIIGTQLWMVENLKVTHFRNGDAIPNVTDATTWSNLTTGAYCDYANTPANSNDYGKIYNFYAVSDSRNICPTGWHVPSDAEWSVLTNYYSGESIAGASLKETGYSHWQTPNIGATNVSGFTALPGGYCDYSGNFQNIGTDGYWWTSTENGDYDWDRSIDYNSIGVTRGSDYSKLGFSVRCLKD